jgi:hypothetical protein
MWGWRTHVTKTSREEACADDSLVGDPVLLSNGVSNGHEEHLEMESGLEEGVGEEITRVPKSVSRMKSPAKH